MGVVWGHFNVRDRAGNILPWTRKSAPELASLCLLAMGSRAGVDLPEEYPEVVWNEVPAHIALAKLCDLFPTGGVTRGD